MYNLLDTTFDRLFPVFRSITGKGIEESMRIIGEHIPFSYHYVPTATKVFDWTVPAQWECTSAVLTGPEGAVIADISDSNLHVVNYSSPVDADLTLEELAPHLYSLPGLPTAIPYVTSYYERSWGFCIPHHIRESLKPGLYHAKINSTFSDGNIMIADTVLPGDCKEEILLTSYMCHPSLANNELSGPLVLLGLYLRLCKWSRRRYSYRFVLHPETIGSLCYLHLKGKHLLDNVVSGMVLTCLGGPSGRLSYKKSRQENAPIDRLALLWKDGQKIDIHEFTPCSGSDERQYCSPGFDLPIGQMARTVYAAYDGYHNSLDNKEFMKIDSLVDSVDMLENFLLELDNSGVFLNLSPYGEPQLGKRGLYPNINSASIWKNSDHGDLASGALLYRILMVLNYSDSCRDMIDIARKCSCSVSQLKDVVDVLEKKELLRFCGSRKNTK